MRILIIEDDERIAHPVADDLRRQHHAVDIAFDGDAGIAYASSGPYDVILLDVMLPKRSGIDICRQLRRARSQAMILMVTARDTTHDKVAGLDAGADDYLVKPVDLAELSARLRALARRQFAVRETIMRSGPISLDPAARAVRCGEAPVSLTAMEFSLLETFLRHPLQVFSRPMLLERIVSLERHSGEESVKTHIANLRRKIRRAGAPYDPIETVYGNGYRLRDPQ